MRRPFGLLTTYSVFLLGAVPSFAITRTWTGAVSANWSNVQNWSPQAVPSVADSLIFPPAASNHVMTNDLPSGTSIGPMIFNAPYTLNGNALTLTGDVTGSGASQGDGLNCNIPLKIGASLLLGTANGPYQTIDVNGQTLTIEANTSIAALNGSGTVNIHKSGSHITFTGDGTFIGTINGAITVNGAMPNANATTDTDVPFTPPARISGTGTLGTVTVNAGGAIGPGVLGPGVLRTKSLVLHDLFLEELAPGSVSDAIQVTGTVSLGGTLIVNIVSGSPGPGQSFTIIDNDGSDPVIGTFAQVSGASGVPTEGSTFTVGTSTFQITYKGGDGNDVVLAAVTPTATGLSQTSTTTTFGDPFTATATVTSGNGTPAGSVTFLDGSMVVATVALQNGSASWTTTDREPGSHSITAAFDGTGIFGGSASTAVVHTVQARGTAVAVNTSASAPHYGDNVTFTAAITPAGSISTPVGGTVSFEADGVVFGSAGVTNGTASVLAALLPAGPHTIVARYSGDSHFVSSVSPGLALTIAKAQSFLTVTSLANPAAPGAARLQVSVSASGHPSLIPSGSVTVTELGSVLGQQSLSGGAAIVALTGLSAGDHELVATFSGDSNFDPSSSSLTQSVQASLLSISSVAVAEGNSGSRLVSLMVQLNGPAPAPVAVSYATADGSARAGMDYEFTSGVVTFAAGEVAKQIDVRIFGDTLPEPDQTFLVVLSGATNAGISNGFGTVTILNDDGPITTPPRRRASGH